MQIMQNTKSMYTKEKAPVFSLESEPHLPHLVNMDVSFIYFAYFMQVLLTQDGDWEVINLWGVISLPSPLLGICEGYATSD